MPTRLLLALVLSAAVAWGFWHAFDGAVGLGLAAPVAAALLARPLLDLASGIRDAMRASLWRHEQGRYFQHHGHAIDIVQDADDASWLRIADVRKVLHDLPADAVLQRLLPEGVGTVPGSSGLRIRADVLVEHLRAAQDPAAIRFKVRLERDVLHLHASRRFH